MLMFLTWLLRFACDANLKKPPPKMMVSLHATLTVKLRASSTSPLLCLLTPLVAGYRDDPDPL